MIRIVFTLAGLWAALLTASAQDTTKKRYWQTVLAHPDTLQPGVKSAPGMKMPVAGAGKPLVYKGKAGNGYSLYQSLHDHMPVLVPDSVYRSAMPVKKFSPLHSDTLEWIVPPSGKKRQPKPLPSYQ